MSFNPLTTNDIDDLIAENGGAGNFEAPTPPAVTERWLFPRFIPNCPTGGEPMTKRSKSGTYVCTEHKAKFDMDDADKYLSRTGIGDHDTDVETLASWWDAPRNIVGMTLVLGEPGTGKTALIEAAATSMGRQLTTVLCTPDHTKDSLFLRFVGEGKGDPVDPDCDTDDCVRSPYTLGPVPYAAKHGHILYMDEFMLLVDGVKPIFYSLADGRRFLPEGNVDGSPLEIHPDFRLVVSSNPQVRGASLPEPIASRAASTTIVVETDAQMLRDLGIDESIVKTWEMLGHQELFQVQIRELRLADYWLGVSPSQAVSAFIPEHCPVSDRKKVRDAVLGMLGGWLPEHGRLVVK